MKNLYQFYTDCYYGCVEGTFIAEDDDVKSLIGKEVYFGEILGKYSDVYGRIQEKEIILTR